MESESKNQPNVNWDVIAAQAFCEICAQEKQDGKQTNSIFEQHWLQKPRDEVFPKN
jgi:hypothetical protein